ncbi:MAG: N-succinylarginine dihydrolase [Sphingomonadales bacterium]
MMREINFDGLIGPSHNYAALSLGNLASAKHGGATSRPRAAALQGLAKMRFVMGLGLPQGFLLPLDRPDAGLLRAMGFAGSDETVIARAAAEDPRLFATAASASAMWTANAATVSPAPDCADGRCHISAANLSRMAHRSIEHGQTHAQLAIAFADPAFAVHEALPAAFGDEGAANFMRLCRAHDAPGLEIFVYGEEGGRFPARQHRRASEAIARRHGVTQKLFVAQSQTAIDAGAFHNDVVAVSNGNVLFAHEQAFADPAALKAELAQAMPEAIYIEVPASAVSLADAISSYLFNSQLLTLPDGSMALVLPKEAEETPSVKAYLDALVAGNGPIRAAYFVDVRESMQNGGGPACLRLRVVADPARVDARFLLDEGKADRLERLVERWWPEAIAPGDMADADLWAQVKAARAALLDEVGLRP